MSELYPLIDEVFEKNRLTRYATEENRKKLAFLLKEMVAFNEITNITAIVEPREIVLRHFADSLTVADRIPQGASVIDVGCGGGFPTLPLAIVRPDLTFTALDSTAKKLVFVEKMAKELQLSVKVLSKRAEEIPEYREGFDLAVSRAVARMNLLAELCLPLVKVGGKLIAMKGASGREELEEAKEGIVLLGGKVTEVTCFTLADAGERTLITVDKEAHTPAQYPRPWGKMKKRPL